MEQIAVASFVAAAICLIEKVHRALAVGEGRRCEEGCPFLPDEGGVNCDYEGHCLAGCKKTFLAIVSGHPAHRRSPKGSRERRGRVGGGKGASVISKLPGDMGIVSLALYVLFCHDA